MVHSLHLLSFSKDYREIHGRTSSPCTCTRPCKHCLLTYRKAGMSCAHLFSCVVSMSLHTLVFAMLLCLSFHAASGLSLQSKTNGPPVHLFSVPLLLRANGRAGMSCAQLCYRCCLRLRATGAALYISARSAAFVARMTQGRNVWRAALLMCC